MNSIQHSALSIRTWLLALAALALAAPAFAQRTVTHGATDQSEYVLIIDETTGVPETGVTSATPGIDLEFVRHGAAPIDLSESDLAAIDSTHSDGGMKHWKGGAYRVDVPDAAYASGKTQVIVGGTVTGMIVRPVTVQLTAFDLQTAAKIVHLNHNGNDATTGTAAQAAIQAATAGTVCSLGPGTFEMTGPLVIPDDVKVIGSGRRATILEFSSGTNFGNVLPGDRSLTKSLTVRETVDSFGIYLTGTQQVLGASFEDVYFDSANLENVGIESTVPSDLTFRDCEMKSVSEWGAGVSGAAHTIRMFDVDIFVTANGSDADFKGVGIADGTTLIADRLTVRTTEGAAAGQALRVTGASKALLSNCTFWQGQQPVGDGGALGGYIHIADAAGYVQAINCEFDRSKVTGNPSRLVDIDTAAAQSTAANTRVQTGVPNATPGAAGGALIAGNNAATTFATLTSTGAFSISGVGNVAQTGDSFARIGANGSSLSSLASQSSLNTLSTTIGTPEDSIATDLQAVADDVVSMQSDLTNGGRLDLIFDATLADTAAIPAFPSNFASLVISPAGAVDALQQGVLDTLFTETTAGRLANNFRLFFANADAATTAVVDDVEGGTIIETRDLTTPSVPLKLPSRKSGRAYVTDPIRIVPGETLKAGIDCLDSIVLPPGAVPATMSTPTGLSGQLSSVKRGINQRYANFDVTATTSAVVGTEQWVEVELTNSFEQGPFIVNVRVLVVEPHP